MGSSPRHGLESHPYSEGLRRDPLYTISTEFFLRIPKWPLQAEEWNTVEQVRATRSLVKYPIGRARHPRSAVSGSADYRNECFCAILGSFQMHLPRVSLNGARPASEAGSVLVPLPGVTLNFERDPSRIASHTMIAFRTSYSLSPEVYGNKVKKIRGNGFFVP